MNPSFDVNRSHAPTWSNEVLRLNQYIQTDPTMRSNNIQFIDDSLVYPKLTQAQLHKMSHFVSPRTDSNVAFDI